MKKQLSEADFNAVSAGLDVGEQTLEIARGVLVNGMRQSHFVEALGLTKGAVSQAVNRVWSAVEADVPQGYERVQAVLPLRQAATVREWDAAARRTIAKIRDSQ
ncbi:MAG: TrfB-related DNA-binding protein [Pseudomonas sp.]